ncbi:tyrosine-type recombinase/integrase [Rhodococcoides fascians]|uniref:tyrosine-type recombinase/integrase n=1 Tax=Rhodococcoides fascians TaxID=1828 RepID=UPI00050D026E|nr:site-specific integrase [Rhodococcus fascians]
MNGMITLGKPYRRKSDMLWVVPINLPRGGDGKRRRKTVARKNRNQAIRAAQQLLKDLENGVISSASTTLLSAWLDYWVSDVLPSKGLRPNTARSYRAQAMTSIKPYLGAYKIGKLTPANIREFHKGIADRGLAVTTAKLTHTILSMSLEDAIEDGIIERNVAAIVGAPKGDTEERESLTVEQAKHLIQTSLDAGDPYAYRWMLALLTGARQGEVIGLTEDRIRLDARTIDLSWALTSIGYQHGCPTKSTGGPSCGEPANRPSKCPQAEPAIPRGYVCTPLEGSIVLAPPKTKKSRRVIPMIAPIEAALRAQLDLRVPNRYGLVWPDSKGRPLNPATDYANWQKALKRAGLPKMPLHSARHTAATLLQALGVPEDVRMQIMGHSTAASQRVYAHVDMATMSNALDQLGGTLLGSLDIGSLGQPAALPAATVVDAEVVEIDGDGGIGSFLAS